MQNFLLHRHSRMVWKKRTQVNEPPLRAELFSVEQLARHAKELAARHRVASCKGSNRLLARLGRN